jgi:beta-galactosidase
VIAVDNGSVVSHESFQATERSAFHGRCIALIRAVADTGDIKITASAEGLESATATIEIVE